MSHGVYIPHHPAAHPRVHATGDHKGIKRVPSDDIFRAVEKFLRAAIVFVISFCSSMYELYRHPATAPDELLVRFKADDIDQIGPITMMVLAIMPFEILITTSFSSLSEIFSPRRHETFLSLVVSCLVGAALLDLYARLRTGPGATELPMTVGLSSKAEPRQVSTGGIEASSVQNDDKHIRFAYDLVRPVFAFSILSAAYYRLGVYLFSASWRNSTYDAIGIVIFVIVGILASPIVLMLTSIGSNKKRTEQLIGIPAVFLIIFFVSIFCGNFVSAILSNTRETYTLADEDDMGVVGGACTYKSGRLDVKAIIVNRSKTDLAIINQKAELTSYALNSVYSVYSSTPGDERGDSFVIPPGGSYTYKGAADNVTPPKDNYSWGCTIEWTMTYDSNIKFKSYEITTEQ